MVLCTVENLRLISKYLQTTPGKIKSDANGKILTASGINNGATVTGFGTIVISLAKGCSTPQFGKGPEDDAVTRQWVEYAVCYANHAESPTVARQVLKELNGVLASRSFLVNNVQTLADVVLYSLLHNVFVHMSYQDKEKYLHVSRWFDNMQQNPKLRQKNKLVVFSRTPLYS